MSEERRADSSTSAKTKADEGRSVYNVLFLCTGNSARSIMAECALNHWGAGKFRAFSAGSHPTGWVHPMALRILRQMNYPTDGLRSKSWDEFSRPDSPRMDFVFTVCAKAAAEACPIWPGQPVTANWGVDDPAAYEGPEDRQLAAFKRAYVELETRIKLFVSLRPEGLDRLALERRLDVIGQMGRATERAG